MKTLIIAEAGVNHNGDIEIAKKLIDVAIDAGADIVKFQTAIPELVMSSKAPKAEYQLNTTSSVETQLEMAKRIHLPLSDYPILKKYAENKGIEFLSTPFDLVSVDYLNEMGMKIWKIPSGEITNLPYLQKIGSYNKPIILSSGMASLSDIESAIEELEKAGTSRDKITILHCTTEYPAPINEVNLKAMNTIAEAFKVKVGYSDHTEGIEIPLAAVALGATVIEKHFTLDKNMEGPDHKASLEPDELKKMIESIRNIELALGNGIKQATPGEIKNKIAARKSIVAAKTIKTGEIFTTENLTVKRPGNGISPMLWNQIIGVKAHRDYQPDDLIER